MKNENSQVDISVICLSYCHEKYVREALESIVRQKSSMKIEVLITDDASTDNTASILKEYESKYDYIRVKYNEVNVGATQNLCFLINQSRGKYIAFLELDDYWTDDFKLDKQYKALEDNPAFIGCVHQFSVINEKNEVIRQSEYLGKKCYGRRFSLRDFRVKGFVIHTSTLFCRNVFGSNRIPDAFWKSDRNRGDISLFYYLLKQGDFYILPDFMSHYRKVLDISKSNVCSQNLRNPKKSRERQVLQINVLIDEFGSSFTLYCFLADAYIMWLNKAARGKNEKSSFIKTFRSRPRLFAVLLIPYRFFVLLPRHIKRTVV